MLRIFRYLSSIISSFSDTVLSENLTKDSKKENEFSPTLPTRPRLLGKFHGKRKKGAIELLNTHKARVLKVFIEAEACTYPVKYRIVNANSHLDLMLVVSDIFPHIAKKYGEAKAHYLIVRAMEPSQ